MDDCWTNLAGGRDASGRLVADPVRFPHGMKWLGDYIHAKGLLFGIYTDIAPTTCGGYTGSGGHFDIDAQTFAVWPSLCLARLLGAQSICGPCLSLYNSHGVWTV